MALTRLLRGVIASVSHMGSLGLGLKLCLFEDAWTPVVTAQGSPVAQDQCGVPPLLRWNGRPAGPEHALWRRIAAELCCRPCFVQPNKDRSLFAGKELGLEGYDFCNRGATLACCMQGTIVTAGRGRRRLVP
jgi:hypothetical protein